MFTGFNSNVERDGQVYHVQTEDKGLGHAVVETRVYSGGQVVAAVEHSYADLADSPDYSEDRILRRMREQHQSLIRGLETGAIEDLEVRLQVPVGNPDVEHLVDEYVEDWIETFSATESILRARKDSETGSDPARPTRRRKP